MNLSLILLLTLALTATSALAYTPGKSYHFTILHTNDHHGNFWKDSKGQFGMAAQKTIVDQVRQEVEANGGQVLLLSAGDFNTGTPRSDMQNATPDILGMNAIGYDAAALGNHEFDKSPQVLSEQIRLAQFPLLSANIYDKENQHHHFAPSLNKTLAGDLKVAIVGFTTEDSTKIANPEYTAPYTFRPALEAAAEIVPALKKENDIVIALTHMGFYQKEEDDEIAPGDVALAQKVDGIDVIVGGHSHTGIGKPNQVGRTIIVQAEEFGRSIGRLDLEFQDGQTKVLNYQLIPINKKIAQVDGEGKPILDCQGNPTFAYAGGHEILENPELYALLKHYYDQGSSELAQVIGEVDQKFLGREAGLNTETNLGRLVAESQREKTQADVGIINNGGLRTSMGPGKISYEDVLKVQPFANTLCTFVLTGSQLEDYLSSINDVYHIAGVKVQKQNNKVKIVSDASQVQQERCFKVVANSFIARGGNSYPGQANNPTFQDTGYNDAHALKDFIAQKKLVKGDEFGEINIVSE